MHCIQIERYPLRIENVLKDLRHNVDRKAALDSFAFKLVCDPKEEN